MSLQEEWLNEKWDNRELGAEEAFVAICTEYSYHDIQNLLSNQDDK